jgi:hypothetical protein
MACSQNTPCHQCPDCLPAPTPLPPCVGGEPCEEVAKANCISYVGPNLPALGILNGDRMLAVLTKLHRVINPLIAQPVILGTYTATNTGTGGNPAPLVVTYLGLGPVYTSGTGATSSSTTITASTTGLAVGMTLEIIAGVGAFAPGTTVASITSPTSFTVSQAPSTALSGGATVIRGTGSNHQIFTITVAVGTPQTFKAFVGSNVVVSGTGTVV